MKLNMTFLQGISPIALTVLAALGFGQHAANAQIKLPPLFSDHMVLQQEKDVPIWGSAQPGEEISIEGGGMNAKATADSAGKWTTKLNPLKADKTAFDLKVSAKSGSTVIKDVLVGDVWVCSGQSNMQFTAGNCSTWKEIETAETNPSLRIFVVKINPSLEPLTDLDNGSWQVAKPDVIKGFSAVGYYFGKEIAETQKIPVGLIGSYVGGTPAEAWIDLKGLSIDPALKKFADKFNDTNTNKDQIAATYEKWLAEGGADFKKAQADWRSATYMAKKNVTPLPPEPKPQTPEPPSLKNNSLPTVLNNGMIAPLIPYAIKGVVWYQGESGGNPYGNLFPALVNGWRKQ